MKIRIYTMTHRHFAVPPDPMYVPLQVGSAVSEDLGCLRDDAGENISAQNCWYSELTGFYWIWKNDRDSDYIGTCHYRRYLINEQEKVLTKREYEALFEENDVVTTKLEVLANSYREGFSANHNIEALDLTGEVIRERYPGYYEEYIRLVNGPKTYYCNMLVTSRVLFGEYAAWLFDIFFEVQRRMKPDTEEDAYHKRVFGFISEFLLTVWLRVRGLRVYECKVGILGEKAETAEVRARLEKYIRERDIDGAKRYFLEVHARRPDILMEAADITGTLRLALQLIATADAERSRTGGCFLDRESEPSHLYPLFSALNRIAGLCACGMAGEPEAEELRELVLRSLPVDALSVAAAVLPCEGIGRDVLLYRLKELSTITD